MMGPDPVMIEIGKNTESRVMKCCHRRRSIRFRIAVAAGEITRRVAAAGQTIHTSMVTRIAWTAMVWRTGGIRQSAEVIVERVVLLHDYDDVANLRKPGCTRRRCRRSGTAAAACDQEQAGDTKQRDSDVISIHGDHWSRGASSSSKPCSVFHFCRKPARR